MKEHDDRNTKENLCPDCGKIYKNLTDLRKHCCMSKHSYPKFQIQIYNFVTVVKLLVECAVVYMKFRDCFLRSLILLHVCSYWWNVQSAMLVECAV